MNELDSIRGPLEDGLSLSAALSFKIHLLLGLHLADHMWLAS